MRDTEDDGGFERVYNRHKVNVYNFCRRMLGDPDEAKDVVQEVFMRYFENVSAFDGEASAKVWLFKSARNRCLNVIRDKGKLSSPANGGDEFAGAGLEGSDEDADIVRSLLDSMNADYREILILREWDQLSYDEIAGTLDTTVSAVKSKLFKARKQAASIYRRLYGE